MAHQENVIREEADIPEDGKREAIRIQRGVQEKLDSADLALAQ